MTLTKEQIKQEYLEEIKPYKEILKKPFSTPHTPTNDDLLIFDTIDAIAKKHASRMIEV